MPAQPPFFTPMRTPATALAGRGLKRTDALGRGLGKAHHLVGTGMKAHDVKLG